MYSVFLLADHSNGALPLVDALARLGMSCQVGGDLSTFQNGASSPPPQAVVLDMASVGATRCRELVDQCKTLRFPVLVVIPSEGAVDFDPSLNPDEFILSPVRDEEVAARIKQAIYRVHGPDGSKILRIFRE